MYGPSELRIEHTVHERPKAPLDVGLSKGGEIKSSKVGARSIRICALRNGCWVHCHRDDSFFGSWISDKILSVDAKRR
jgi:hypothetical protein